MKKVLAFGLGLTLLFAVAGIGLTDEGAGDHKGHDMKKSMSEFKGEIIDLTCYISHPASGKGKEHQKCAENCIKKGLPVGMLTDDGLSLLVGSDHTPLNEKLAPLAGKVITVYGEMKHQDGMMLIGVNRIGEAEGATTKGATTKPMKH